MPVKRRTHALLHRTPAHSYVPPLPLAYYDRIREGDRSSLLPRFFPSFQFVIFFSLLSTFSIPASLLLLLLIS